MIQLSSWLDKYQKKHMDHLYELTSSFVKFEWTMVEQ